MNKTEIKIYYPYKDYILASEIIRILALSPKISSKRVSVLLSDAKKSATPPAIKIALQRLVDTDYVIKKSTVRKTQTDNVWELSCVGKLASLTILSKKELESFAKTMHEVFENKFYAMIAVLLENSKQEFVRLLTDRLNKIKDDVLKLENTALDWYNDMRLKISNMDTVNYPKFKTLQEKINRDGFDPIMLNNKGFTISSIFSKTRLDRIC